MDFANDGNQWVIDCDTFLKDGHHGVPRYQRLAVEVICSSGHEPEEENGAFVHGLESVSEDICWRDDNFRHLVALQISF
jgi:hypothetical protein